MFGFLKKLFGFDQQTLQEANVILDQEPPILQPLVVQEEPKVKEQKPVAAIKPAAKKPAAKKPAAKKPAAKKAAAKKKTSK